METGREVAISYTIPTDVASLAFRGLPDRCLLRGDPLPDDSSGISRKLRHELLPLSLGQDVRLKALPDLLDYPWQDLRSVALDLQPELPVGLELPVQVLDALLARGDLGP